MAKKITPPMVKHGFAIQQNELDELKRIAWEQDTTASAITRRLARGFLAGLIKLPTNEAIARKLKS